MIGFINNNCGNDLDDIESKYVLSFCLKETLFHILLKSNQLLLHLVLKSLLQCKLCLFVSHMLRKVYKELQFKKLLSFF